MFVKVSIKNLLLPSQLLYHFVLFLLYVRNMVHPKKLENGKDPASAIEHNQVLQVFNLVANQL